MTVPQDVPRSAAAQLRGERVGRGQRAARRGRAHHGRLGVRAQICHLQHAVLMRGMRMN